VCVCVCGGGGGCCSFATVNCLLKSEFNSFHTFFQPLKTSLWRHVTRPLGGGAALHFHSNPSCFLPLVHVRTCDSTDVPLCAAWICLCCRRWRSSTRSNAHTGTRPRTPGSPAAHEHTTTWGGRRVSWRLTHYSVNSSSITTRRGTKRKVEWTNASVCHTRLVLWMKKEEKEWLWRISLKCYFSKKTLMCFSPHPHFTSSPCSWDSNQQLVPLRLIVFDSWLVTLHVCDTSLVTSCFVCLDYKILIHDTTGNLKLPDSIVYLQN